MHGSKLYVLCPRVLLKTLMVASASGVLWVTQKYELQHMSDMPWHRPAQKQQQQQDTDDQAHSRLATLSYLLAKWMLHH